jgi:hypothetical protein
MTNTMTVTSAVCQARSERRVPLSENAAHFIAAGDRGHRPPASSQISIPGSTLQTRYGAGIGLELAMAECLQMRAF